MNPYDETRAWRLACLTIEGSSRPAGHLKTELQAFIPALQELRETLLKIQKGSKVDTHLLPDSLPAIQQKLQVLSPMLKRAQVLLQAVNSNNPAYTIIHLADYMLSVVTQTKIEFLYDQPIDGRHSGHHTRSYMPPSIAVVKSFILSYPGLFAPLPAMLTLVNMPSLTGILAQQEMFALMLRKKALRDRILTEMLLTAEDQSLLIRCL